MDNILKISPRAIAHLGANLIENESIALLELAKNAYDACASGCNVHFRMEGDELVEIVVEDDGAGMTMETVTQAYLTIGTNFKDMGRQKTTCGRVPLGEKGIGRLGIHKLGSKIKVVTRAKDSSEIEILIDWSKLDEAVEVKDFTIPVKETGNKYFPKSTGTKIFITELKKDWERRELRQVYRDLLSLNSPFYQTKDVFNVKVTSNQDVFSGLPTFDVIRNAALYSGRVKMSGSVIVDFNYEFKPWPGLSKIQSGRVKSFGDLLDYEKNIVDRKLLPVDLNASGVGDVEFEVLIYELSSDIFSYIGTERKSIKDFLKENGGVRVYRDGLRVYNYGEKDNDWLGLDRRRINRFAGNVANGMIIGAASLSRAMSYGLEEKTNREGFIDNKSFEIFRSAVEYALSLVVKERNIDKEILNTLYKKNKVIEPVLSDLREVIEYVQEQITDEKKKREILDYLTRINSQYAEVREVLLKSANAGLNFSMVVHEVQKQMSALTGFIRRNQMDAAIDISTQLEQIIDGYSTMIKNSDIALTPLSKIVGIVSRNLRFRYSDHEIKVYSNEDSSDLQAFLAESKAISVLTNLADNAIFWLKYAVKEGRKFSMFITDQLTFDGQKFNSIVVSDNGPGLNIPTEMAIRPFVSGKPHNFGSGLGLHVASEMMHEMKGHLTFLQPYDIDLPVGVTNEKITKAIIAISFPIKK